MNLHQFIQKSVFISFQILGFLQLRLGVIYLP